MDSQARSHTTVTHQSWFGRLGQSCGGVCVGIILCIVAPALLFWNEGRAIDTARAIHEASTAVIPISQSAYDSRNDGSLIAVSGLMAAPISSIESLGDAGPLPSNVTDILNDELSTFRKNAGGSLLHLSRDVSYYEWQETRHTRKQKTVGGGETTTTTYSYDKSWVSTHRDSSSFDDQYSYYNPPAQYSDESFTTREPVELTHSGKDTGFSLNSMLVSKVISRAHGGTNVGPSVIWRPSTGEVNPPGITKVGDHQFSWKAVGPKVVSAIAMQLSGGQLSTWMSPRGRYFLYINIGTYNAKEMIVFAENENEQTTWLLRAVGIIIWWFALTLIAKPISVMADVGTIPCLGFEPGTLIEYLTGCIAFFVALALSTITIAVAWLFYRPMFSIILLSVAGMVACYARKQVVAKKQQLQDQDVRYDPVNIPYASENTILQDQEIKYDPIYNMYASKTTKMKV